ncbi:hypothetical protein C0995_011212, partial [Termitomyces sp. Mi166
MSKGKGKAVAMIKNESHHGQFLSEDKQESEEAKAEAAQQHWAINDFFGHISDGLGVKVNTVHIRANANQAAAFEFNSHQQAKVPTTIVYKYALRGLPRTSYELEQLYKYYANEHVPQRDHVVMYMLISELLLFAQQLDDNLHDHTMQ